MAKKLGIALVLALLLVVPLSAQSGPQLVNPGLERPYIIHGANEVEVAHGWTPAYLEGNDRWCTAPCRRPEFKPEERIAVAGVSQRWFSTYSRQFGTISQSVDVTQGKTYKFSCQVYAISEPMGQMAGFVGIHPWGGGPFSRQMIWGREQVGDKGWIYRQWTEVSVTAVAWSNRITVAMAGNNEWATQNNAVYWDNCSIEEVQVQGECPECPECPTGGTVDYSRIEEIVRSVIESIKLETGEE